MQDWFHMHRTLIYSLSGISLGMLLVTPIPLVIFLIELPYDYFAENKRPKPHIAKKTLSVFRVFLLFLKNLLGFALILAGLTMLLLPGQGLLTMLLGVFLMNFPGKYRLERWLVMRGSTLRVINRLRLRFRRSPLILAHTPGGQSVDL